MLSALPPLVVVKGRQGRVLAWADDLLRLWLRETANPRPGQQAVIDQLARLMFIQAVRGCLDGAHRVDGQHAGGAGRPRDRPGAAFDARPPGGAVDSGLAGRRGVFVAVGLRLAFKTLVSQSPLQYLLEHRMQRAAELLVGGRCGIKEIAAQVGYATRAAFSNAFKRWSGGTSPGAYKRLGAGSARRSGARA